VSALRTGHAWGGAIARGVYLVGCALVLLLLLAPILVIVPVSFSSASFLQFPPPGWSLRWYREYFGRTDWVSPTLLSFGVALATAAVATPLGTLAAYSVTRGHYRGRTLARAFVLSPMIVPLILVALATYLALAHLRLIGSVTGLVAAHAVLAIPKVFVVVTASLRGLDAALEQAAVSLGASPLRAFVSVTLPLIRTGVLVGAVLAFLASFDEVVVAIFIGGSGAVTLPKKMWEGIRLEYNPIITAVSSLLMTFTVIVLAGMGVVRRRLVARGGDAWSTGSSR
jgi:putative spermidine/putrescine transport system permease protein